MTPIDEEAILEEVLEEVESMDEATLEEAAKKVLAQQEKRKAYRSNKEKTPEQLELQKSYRKKRYQRDKAIIERAKELGLAGLETEEVE